MGKLVPGAATLKEAGQLCELLVLLGHFEDAKVLQRELAQWLSQHNVGDYLRAFSLRESAIMKVDSRESICGVCIIS